MKPTPAAQLRWSLLTLVLIGSALNLWGCGHTREIVYPERKLSPPRILKNRFAGPKQTPVESLEAGTTSPRPDAPTSIDVPMIDRTGR